MNQSLTIEISEHEKYIDFALPLHLPWKH